MLDVTMYQGEFNIECPSESYADLDGSSDVDFALINSSSRSKCSLIVNLNTDTLFVGIGSLRVEILTLKSKFASTSKQELRNIVLSEFWKHIIIKTEIKRLRKYPVDYWGRLMTISSLYPCGKPCSTGTHRETVRKLIVCSAFDRSNHDRTTTSSLLNGHSSERKCEKKTR